MDANRQRTQPATPSVSSVGLWATAARPTRLLRSQVFLLACILAMSCETSRTDDCQPLTCHELGKNCGRVLSRCGLILECGTCGPGESCGAGGESNVCAPGSCTPRTCEALGAECGQLSDACSEVLACGECTPGEICGGGGFHRCGSGTCKPRTCVDAGASCGTIDDGCGATLVCGACLEPESCGGSGTPNVCGGQCTQDEHCGAFERCDADRRCLSRCTTSSSSPPRVSIDVPRVQVHLQLTLNGDALGPVQGRGDVATPWIELIDGSGARPARFQVFWLEGWVSGWTATPVRNSSVHVVPGRYEVFYTAGPDPFPGWPQNDRRRLGTVELTTSATIAIDVSSLPISLVATLNGAALEPVMGRGSAASPSVELVESDGSRAGRFRVYRFDGGVPNWTATPASATPIFVMPGTYDLIYAAGAEPFPGWPQNSQRRLQTGLTLSQPGTISTNVESVNVEFDVTLNGQPRVQVTGSGPAALPWVELRDADGSPAGRLRMFRFEGSTSQWTATPLSPLTVAVLPGTYTTWYTAGADPFSNWPQNSNRRIGPSQDLRSHQTVILDIESVEAALALTLNGSVPSPISGSGDVSTPWVQLIDTGGSLAGRFQIFRLEGSVSRWTAVPTTALRTFVMPGTYHVRYTTEADPPPGWPQNATRSLLSNIAISSAHTVAIDLESVRVEIEPTLNGSPRSLITGRGQASTPSIEIRDEASNPAGRVHLFRFDGGSSNWTATPVAELSAFVMPGRYDLLYTTEDQPLPGWPQNRLHRLTSESITSARSIVVDLPSRPVALEVMIGGQMRQSVVGRGAASSPWIEMHDQAGSLSGRLQLYRFERGGAEWTATPVSDLNAHVVPGTYGFSYAAGDEPFPEWPINGSGELGCANIDP